MFSVWFATTGTSEYRENPDSIKSLMDQLAQYAYKRYKPALSAELADAIIFIEPNYYKFWNYPKLLLSNELIKKYINKSFSHEYSDSGVVFLPGAYVCTPYMNFNPLRTRASGYYNHLGVYNEYLEKYNFNFNSNSDENHINYLFSFRGSKSSRVRDLLFKQDFSSVKNSVHDADRWFNHSESEKENYVKEILQSKFVLAPRGIGTASIRLFEIMQLGRVPVIISDDWVPPIGPAWNEFSIRVAEDKISDLPRIISEREADWKGMGELARYTWKKYYSPDIVLFRLIECIEDLINARPISHDERQYAHQWQSLQFAWEQNWTFPQRVHQKVKRIFFKK